MKGDFTRDTFRPGRHYWGVLRQQGRVDLDADWNEQIRIARHQVVTGTLDAIGAAGGPAGNAGFELTVDGSGDVFVSAGRYYVAGMLIENDADVALAVQPDRPGEAAPAAAGFHLAYLDVWDRHVTALDDPPLRETALGGPDTATRARTVWQVRTRKLAGVTTEFTAAVEAFAAATDAAGKAAALQTLRELIHGAYCGAPLDPAGGSLAAGTGTMAARAAKDADTSANPCAFEAGGGYRRLENRLYRVEIHDPGNDVATTAATYKWSRDNGSVVVSVEEFRDTGGGTTTTEITVRRLGLDATQELTKDDWIEIVSDDLVAAGLPGQLVQIATQPDPSDRILVLTSPVDIKAAGLHPQVRRWNLPVDGLASVRKTWQELDEDGVQVRFGVGDYHTGDYWVIPARTNTADVEWPPLPEYPGHEPAGGPAQLAPFGIAHQYAPLAALVHDGTQIVAAVDLRSLFPPSTDVAVFAYAGGDGQQPVLPSGAIPQPLQCSVTNGSGPITGVLVEFEVVEGTSKLARGAATGTLITVPTDAGGISSIDWTVDPADTDHRVRARLLDDCGSATHAPVFFSARVNYQLHYLSGDGQSGAPGEKLAPLRVWVSDGRWPVQGEGVAFGVTSGTGTLSPATPVVTDADGIAEVVWTLDAGTYRQQVQAQLIDGAGNPVHIAAMLFNAVLSDAAHVAYTPAAGCTTLAHSTTVEEALDELCRVDRSGGCCTISLVEGDDVEGVFASLGGAGKRDITICFAEGRYEVGKALRVDGFGHVRLSGVGRGTQVVVRSSRSVFVFTKCRSVTVRDLDVHAPAEADDGSFGALDIEDCGAVCVEGVTATCGSAAQPVTAGIAVRRSDDPRNGLAEPIRISSCDVTVGEQQHGIVIANGDRIHIEDNTVGSAEVEPGFDIRRLLATAEYLEKATASLVRFVDRADPAPIDLPRGAAGQLVTVSQDDWSVTFVSPVENRKIWAEEIAARNPTTAAEARRAVMDIARSVLQNAGVLGNRLVFRTWFRELLATFRVAGLNGIVVDGTVVQDLRVLNNSITGLLCGVTAGFSREDGDHEPIGSMLLSGNRVVVPANAVAGKDPRALAVRDVASLVATDNFVQVGSGKEDVALSVIGLSVEGAIGPRLVIGANHFAATVVGVHIQPSGEGPRVRRWVAVSNVATDGVMLLAPCEVREDGNVPPRPNPCPGDQAP